MTFKEKIRKIVRANKLGINSPSGLEGYIKAGVGAITKYLKNDDEPGEDTIKKILDLPGLNKTWWETGEGDVFIAASKEKHTNGENQGDIPEIPLGVNLDDESKKLLAIANKTVQYAFVPKTILEGEYRIELKSTIEEKTELRRDAIQGYKKLVRKLEEEIADLRSGRIPINAAAAQNAK